MDIEVSYDSNVSSLSGSEATLFKSAINYVVNLYDRIFTNPVTLLIDVGWQPQSDLGQSEFYPSDYTYSQVRAGLIANAESATQITADASLPVADPTSGDNISLTGADAAAIGLQAGPAYGSVTFDSNLNYSFLPNVTPAFNEYYFIGVVEHEFSEIMGRVSDEANSGISEMDLFRYWSGGTLNISGAGTRDLSTTAGDQYIYGNSYFSINGGTTALGTWNDVATNGDLGDWAQSQGADAYDYASGAGFIYSLSNLDLAVMNAIGWSVVPVVDNFAGNAESDILLENSAGAIVTGQVANGQLNYATVANVGPQWNIDGSGDFLGAGEADALFYNTSSGALVIGAPVYGEAPFIGGLGGLPGDTFAFTQVGGVGPDWTYGGSGNFLDGPSDDFLLHNSNSGALVVAEVTNGSAVYTPVGGFGNEWNFEGTGDLLNDGNAGFLLHDSSSGALVVGEVSNGSAVYTPIGGVGNDWQFEGTGNFLGNGHDDFLVWNANSGALVVGDVTNGTTSYTTIGGIGSEWHFLGTGDYQGTGVAGFMVESTSGAIVMGTIANGQASFTQVGAVGSEWSGKTGGSVA